MSSSSKASSTVRSSSGTPMRQSSLSFNSKRQTGAVKKQAVKGSRTPSRKSSTVPGTPQPATPIAVRIYTEEGEDVHEEAKRVYPDDSETLRDKEEAPVKRRKLAIPTIASHPATPKERLGARGRAVFRSREGVENATNGGIQPDDDVGELPQLAALEKSRPLIKLYGEARAKMGNLEPSKYTFNACTSYFSACTFRMIWHICGLRFDSR